MRTIAMLLVIFFTQCTYLRAESKVELRNVGDFISSNSCIFGVKSVSMVLYKSHNIQGELITINESCPNIDPSRPVIFLVHGFVSSTNISRMQELATRLAQEYDVVLLDWSQAACYYEPPILKYTTYPSAVKNTHEIGRFLASYVNFLIKQCGILLNNIKFLGHSLGAHVSGFAAKEIKKLNYGNRIPLIIAADPASPMFGNNNCEERLCMLDTERLVVLHTSILGISGNIGHLDLYFDGGKMQSGCGTSVVCSHSRSVDYISDIVGNNCGFPGVPNSSSSYPDSNTTNCIFVNSKILDINNSITGKYYIFVDKNYHCTQKMFNCKQQ